MRGYSDRIHHALSYLAKHYHPRAPSVAPLPFVTQPYNVVLILARHGADETTIIAGILHPLLEITYGSEARRLATTLRDKFGTAAIATATAAVVPRLDDRGAPLAWRPRTRVLLQSLAAIPPRALEIRCANAIHECGSAISLVNRLGPEYLAPEGMGTGHEMLDWYEDLLQSLGRRADWPGIPMRLELATLVADLRRLTRPS